MNDSSYGVHSEFDLQKHKENFVNYLEVIIHPDGTVHYAVPSHQLYLQKYGANLKGMTEKEFEDSVPPNYYCDYLNWLLTQTGCVSVWSIGYACDETLMTEAQKVTLRTLIDEGLTKNETLV